MLTCSKTYRDIPFAHRQHRHDGHCALIHGHNWAITLTFACRKADANGFVVDFGDLKYLKTWIVQNLDHACLFNESDPESDALPRNLVISLKLTFCPTPPARIAQHLHGVFNPMVRAQTEDRVWVTQVEVEEDSKNSATYLPNY